MQLPTILSILAASTAVSGLAVPRSLPGTPAPTSPDNTQTAHSLSLPGDVGKHLTTRQSCSIKLGYGYECGGKLADAIKNLEAGEGGLNGGLLKNPIPINLRPGGGLGGSLCEISKGKLGCGELEDNMDIKNPGLEEEVKPVGLEDVKPWGVGNGKPVGLENVEPARGDPITPA